MSVRIDVSEFWSSFRNQFPVTRNYAYLNSAGVAPLSAPAAEAMRRYVEEISTHGATRYSRMLKDVEATRQSFARLIGAEKDEIAFVANTSDGLSLVANGIDWKAGDRVLVPDHEFPANVYPWLGLRDQGVEVERIPFTDGCCRPEEIEKHLPGARLLTVSAVTYANGFRFDLETLGALCKKHGVRFCVDGIQALGVLPIDVKRMQIDYLAADGHKWLLSPEGAGCFYISRDSLSTLRPSKIGWYNFINEYDFANIDFTFKPHAGRFEEGTLNVPGLTAFGASLDFILETGVERISARIKELSDQLIVGLKDLGYTIRSPRDGKDWSGIVSFAGDGQDEKRLTAALEAKVFIAYRNGALRASPHAFNNQEDIDRLLRVLQQHSPV